MRIRVLLLGLALLATACESSIAVPTVVEISGTELSGISFEVHKEPG